MAFALPILHELSKDPYGIFALVITPTRELAFQICDQFTAVGRPIGVKCEVVTGGRDVVLQGQAVALRPHVIVATPGRLADHLRSGNISLENLRFVVLDEADRLLDGPYDEDEPPVPLTGRATDSVWFGMKALAFGYRSADHLAHAAFSLDWASAAWVACTVCRMGGSQNGGPIFEALPEKRQTLMFSATMTDAIQRVKELTSSGNPGKEPLYWSEDAEASDEVAKTVATLDQRYVLVPPGGDVREALLVQLLLDFRAQSEHGSAIVFTKTCKECQVLSMLLTKLGFSCVPLHARLKQSQRLASLVQFKSMKSKVLVATDVASRGLDIPHVDLVLNHSIPRIPKEYIHRVGRTARAGRGGAALTLINPNRDIKYLHAIEKAIGVKMEERKVSDRKSLKILTQVSVMRRESELQLVNEGFDEKNEINKRKAKILSGEIVEKRKKAKVTK